MFVPVIFELWGVARDGKEALFFGGEVGGGNDFEIRWHVYIIQ